MRAAVAHADLPAELHLRRRAGERHILRDAYLPRFRAAGVEAVVGAVFVHPMFLPEAALSAALGQIAALEEELADCPAFALATTAAELDAALDAGRIAVVLAMEGAEPLRGEAALLPVFFRLGVRILGLAWNGRNAFADGCALSGGLTPAGRRLAETAWSLGMALDVSHLSDAGLADLLALGGGPVLASHSNCRALTGVRRNLTDGQLALLGSRGAVVGVNQVGFLARRPGTDDGLGDLCAHLLHTAAMAGPGCPCLGLDVGQYYEAAVPRPRSYRPDPGDADLLPGYEGLSGLAEALADRGMPPAQIAAVFHGNLLSFLRRSLPGGSSGCSTGGSLV